MYINCVNRVRSSISRDVYIHIINTEKLKKLKERKKKNI